MILTASAGWWRRKTAVSSRGSAALGVSGHHPILLLHFIQLVERYTLLKHYIELYCNVVHCNALNFNVWPHHPILLLHFIQLF